MIVVPFLFFLSLIIGRFLIIRRLDLYIFALMIYAVSALFSIFAINIPHSLSNSPIEIGIIPTITYCSLIALIVSPLKRLNPISINGLTDVNVKLFTIVSWFYFALFILLVCEFGGNIYNILLNGDFHSIRMAHYEGKTENVVASSFIMRLLFLVTGLFLYSSILMIPFFFYSVVKLNKSWIFNLMLLISSFSKVISGILSADRTNIIYWLLLFGACFFIFLPVMTQQHIRVIKKVTIGVSCFLCIYMISVTVSRFTDQDVGTGGSIISYAGQSFINYCFFFDNFPPQNPTFHRIFPSFYKYVLDYNIPHSVYRDMLSLKAGFPVNVFTTFLGTMIVDIGIFGMIFYSLLLYFFLNFIIKKRRPNQLSLGYILRVYIVCSIPVLGIFYYPYYTYINEFAIFVAFILSFYIDKKYNYA